MIAVLTFLQARPERLNQLVDAIQGMIEPSLQSPGCLGMHLHSHPDDPCRLMIYEQWVSKTDFDVNGAQPQTRWLWAHRMDFLEADMETLFFDLVNPVPVRAVATA